MNNKGFIAHIVLFIVGIAVFAVAVVAANQEILIQSREFLLKTLPKRLPVYTQERRLQDKKLSEDFEEQEKGENSPLIFIPIETSDLNSRYHIDVVSLANNKVSPVSCLRVENSQYTSLTNIAARVSDLVVIDTISKIENYEFSDESKSYNEDGTLYSIENKGERSKHKVGFAEICKAGNTYFFSFSAVGEKTHIGGGGSAPSHFAYVNSSGKFTMLEKMVSVTQHIKLPKRAADDYSVPDVTTSIAYYGCGTMYYANDEEVLISCGGGDGPASGGSILRVDLKNKIIKEKVFCSHSSVGKYADRCVNETGKIYYQTFNK